MYVLFNFRNFNYVILYVNEQSLKRTKRLGLELGLGKDKN